MKIIEIESSDVERMYSFVDKLSKYSKKMKECFEDLMDGQGIDQRFDDDEDDDMGQRYDGGYINRTDGYRGEMGQRRGVKGTGRYSRYR